MSIFSWLRDWHRVGHAGRALFKRALFESSNHQNISAVEHYTAAIDTPGIPQDIKAMALYNRALLYAAEKEIAKATTDLNTLLDLPAPLRQIKSAARQKLDRMNHGHAPVSPRTPSQLPATGG